MTRAIRFALAATVVAIARPAVAERLTVKVVEIAGGSAYLDAGRTAGVLRGTKVKFGRDVLVVVEVTEKTSVVELGKTVLRIGSKGTAQVTPGAATTVTTLAKPRPPEAFTAQWPDPVVPADDQSPTNVPLGSGRRRGRAHVLVVGHAFGVADRDGTDGQAEARVVASFDLLTERPLAADLDVAARAFRDGANSGARVPVFVRAAQLRYGDAYHPQFALGRMRYAAASVGMLDGARASARVSNFELAAFGGLVPDPINGKPDTGASRFGGEVIYGDDTSTWRPRLAVTGYGSTWEGELDERRLTVAAAANRGSVHLDGWAEAQSFASSNPWGARAVELTGAGGTAQWRSRGAHLGGDVTFLRPERSLRLAAALPPEWACTRQPQAGDVLDEACTGGDSWVSGSLFAGKRGAWWSVDAIGAVGRTNGVEISYDTSGYLAGELRHGTQRLLAGVSGGRASFARWMAGHVGVGFALSRQLDVALRYRPELLDYSAATAAYRLHSVVADAHVVVTSTLDVAVSAIGTTGADRDAVALLTTVAWRPLP